MNTPLNDALKPCPCCGCHNPKFTSDAVHHFRHTIKCQDCPMLAEFYSSTRDQAIAAWNRRANTQESSAAQGAMTVTEYGWLVENGRDVPDLRYRTMDVSGITWTDDHNKGLRFARRADAEMFAAEDEDAWRIVQHGWDSFVQSDSTAQPTHWTQEMIDKVHAEAEILRQKIIPGRIADPDFVYPESVQPRVDLTDECIAIQKIRELCKASVMVSTYDVERILEALANTAQGKPSEMDQIDAERYRWLRGGSDSSTRWSRWKIEFWSGASGWEPMQNEHMDTAIDSAIKKETNER